MNKNALVFSVELLLRWTARSSWLALLLVTVGAVAAEAYFIKMNAADPPAIVRMAVVVDVGESGLLDELLPDFEKHTGYRTEVYSGTIV